ncbi:hypothetical protein J7J95_01150 [bacterium]|nr:hypothetical protein [bacterium]
MENLDLPATPTETTQVDRNPPTLSQTKVLKKESKFLKPLLYILASILLLTLGAFGFWFYQEKTSQKEPPSSLSKTTPSPELSPSPTQTKKLIEWVTYEDEKIDYLKFKYPKGGVVRKLKDEEGTYTLEMVYKDLRLEISTLTGGLGGMLYNTGMPYTIVYGNYYKGIGKWKSLDSTASPNEIEISYFRFENGGLQFGGFLIGTSMFTFRVPNELLSSYEWIADTIACSVWGVKPDEQAKVAKIYVHGEYGELKDKRFVMKLEDNGAYSPITLEPQEKDEVIERAMINFDGSFLLIETLRRVKPNVYEPGFLYVFDLKNNSLVAIDGSQKLPIWEGSFWINNSEFVYISRKTLSKYYKANVKDKTKVEITEEELSRYTEENAKRNADNSRY